MRSKVKNPEEVQPESTVVTTVTLLVTQIMLIYQTKRNHDGILKIIFNNDIKVFARL